MIRKNKLIFSLLYIFLALIISLSILLLSVRLVVYDEGIYKKEFSKYNVYENLKGVDIESINKEVLGYFKGKQNLETDFFTLREKEHLRDVKNLIQFLNILLLSLVIIIVVISILLFKIGSIPIYIGKILLLTSLIIWLIAGVSYPFAILGFKNSFDSFHEGLFKEGSWLFDPVTENIVVLYPEGFFYDMGKIILLVCFGWSLLFFFVGLALELVDYFNLKIKHF